MRGGLCERSALPCPLDKAKRGREGERGRLRLIAHLLLPRFSTESPKVPNLGNGDEAPGGEAARPLLISDGSTIGMGPVRQNWPRCIRDEAELF